MGQNQPKKLVLSRETVRDLTKDELLGIQAGKNKPTYQTDVDSNEIPCRLCCL